MKRDARAFYPGAPHARRCVRRHAPAGKPLVVRDVPREARYCPAGIDALHETVWNPAARRCRRYATGFLTAIIGMHA